jgi:hypothetical protein
MEMPNNPSYSNLGGSGSRASVLWTGASPAYASGASGPPVTKTYTVNNTFTSADYGNRLVTISWTANSVNYLASAQITAATSSTLTLNETTCYAPASGGAIALPTSTYGGFAVTNLALTSGGPFLVNCTAVPSTGFVNHTFDDVTYYHPGDPNILLAGIDYGQFNGLLFSTGSGQQSGPDLAVGGPYYLLFDFGYPFATGFAPTKIISEVTIHINAQTSAAQGVWKWQASNDNAAWTDVSAQFTLNAGGGTAFQVQTIALTAKVGYRYYRMLGISGTPNASTDESITQILFKIDDYIANAYATNSPYTATQNATFESIARLHAIGASPTSPNLQGIVYADDFSSGWAADGQLTSSAGEQIAVRMGTVSLSCVSTAGGLAYVKKTLASPINLLATDLLLNLCVTSSPSSGAAVAGIVANVQVTDILGNTANWNLSGGCALGAQVFNGWVPRYSVSLSLGAHSNVSTSATPADLTKIVKFQVHVGNNAGQQMTISLDSLIFAQKAPNALIYFRSDPQYVISTLMFMDWVNAFYPAVKVTADVHATAPGSGIASTVDSTTGVGPNGTGYGNLLAAYQKQLAHGHRMMNYILDCGTRPQATDAPLSAYSNFGFIQQNRYIYESLGFPSADMRVMASGSGSLWTPVDVALWAAAADRFDQALTPNQRPSQFNLDQTLSGDSIDLSSDAQNAILDAVFCNGLCGIFQHLQDIGATTGWNPVSPTTRYTPTKGGAAWSIDSTARPELTSAMQLVESYLAPALAGTLSGVPTNYAGVAPAPAKMVTVGQLASMQVSGGGGPVPIRVDTHPGGGAAIPNGISV